MVAGHRRVVAGRDIQEEILVWAGTAALGKARTENTGSDLHHIHLLTEEE
jgi:hypothetical protein